ncbi:MULTISPECIES: GTP-binding protein [Nocardiaceae]|uniref:sulfate adenylyltransferase n=1 Tax=Rhodococcoides kroppenstedtii TaxID=293050 RepID=A0ABS7NS55_9NOCA|nr:MULTISPECIES: GTP-binding protein [Rhodococcus]AMY18453.1 Bifunctional enzyme CysN/CysC [Rhodococcus sp. PBTS 1]MBY6312413.1 50S ribosome-binding GTPase [Rhodococcus kroppenstedtii]MBY6320275.1 50S ribosome-binding GTPase [Rhodococcus kroppenstedtii]MBY6398704.1 50S ribosome-binding GTPase [Rhodococcus kroppenstedtii]
MTVTDVRPGADASPDSGGVAPRQLLRIATAGSVDDGKSTLIGRLLHDTDSLPLDHLESVTDEDGVADLAALSDGLRAEREQGITIDVAYRFFSTPTRSYVLADTPGHERYTRNMFTGASNANVAILLVDARAGVLRQTRRHARIATLVGVDRLVATVNKMDIVDYDEARFRAVEAELVALGARLGTEILVIPIAAKPGDNVVHRSAAMPWYDGPTLLDHLEGIDLAAPAPVATELRLPVQWVSRPTVGERRRYTGRLSAGTLQVGDPVVALPSGSRSVVTALDTLDENRDVAVAPLSVSVELADDIDVARGDVLVSGREGAHLPVLAREIDATVCWLGEQPVAVGDRVALKHTTTTVRATVHRIHSRLDPETLDETAGPSALSLNDIARVTLRTSAVVVSDDYVDNRDAGAFILVDEHTNDTVAAGIVEGARDIADRGESVAWTPSALPADDRAARTGQRGAVLLVVNPDGVAAPAAGIEDALTARGRNAYALDGAALRSALDLSPDARSAAIHLARVARLLADAGVVAVLALDAADPAVLAAVHQEIDAAGVERHDVADADAAVRALGLA